MSAGDVCDGTHGHIGVGFETGVLELFDRRVHIQAHLVAVLFQCHPSEATAASALPVVTADLSLSIGSLTGSAALSTSPPAALSTSPPAALSASPPAALSASASVASAGDSLTEGDAIEPGRCHVMDLGEFAEDNIRRVNFNTTSLEVCEHGFEVHVPNLLSQLGEGQQLSVGDRGALLGLVPTVLYALVPGVQRREGRDVAKGAKKNDDAHDQREYPFGAQGEGFGDFALEIDYERLPVEVHVKGRCDDEDEAEPKMQGNPLVLCEGEHGPAGPVCDPAGRDYEEYDSRKGHPNKG